MMEDRYKKAAATRRRNKVARKAAEAFNAHGFLWREASAGTWWIGEVAGEPQPVTIRRKRKKARHKCRFFYAIIDFTGGGKPTKRKFGNLEDLVGACPADARFELEVCNGGRALLLRMRGLAASECRDLRRLLESRRSGFVVFCLALRSQD